MKKIIASALIVSLLSACATRPENVVASHVSSLKYESVDCRRIAVEADDVNAKLSSLTANLDSKATTDAVLTTVGLIVFWPALFGLAATGGKAEEQELARLKGEKAALEQASLQKNCGVSKQVSN